MGHSPSRSTISRTRVAGLALMGLFLLWSIGPAQADAAKCGGRKADVVGGPGDNVLKSDKHGVQVIVGGGGDDLIISKRNKDIVCGGPGNDRIFSGTGRDKVYGGSGNDYLHEGPGSGKVWANGGDDIIVGGGGGERMRGGAGNDKLIGEIQDDKMFGDAGDDTLIGGQGIDRMVGGGGNDWLRGDTNQDKYFGESGDDTASFATATPPGPHPTRDGVDVEVGSGSARGDDSQERLAGIENVVGSIFEDRITGAGGGFVRGGGGGDDCNGFTSAACPSTVGSPPTAYVANGDSPDPGVVVYGGAGSDSVTINENSGSLNISGNVTAGPGCSSTGGGVVCARPAVEFGYILLWGAEGNDNLNIGGGISPTTGVKGDGGPGDDVLNGGPAADTLFPGASGSDRLLGGPGDDALAARPGGGDVLVGGPGNDNLATDDACAGHTYDGGGGGADVAGFAQAGEGAGVLARLGGSAVRRGASGCNPTKVAGNLEVLEGTRNADILHGNGGIDLVIGREGNDVLDGHGGKDELRGDAGNDSCPDRSAIKLSC